MTGDTIISELEENKDVYIIIDGEAIVTSSEGREIAVLVNGDHFGEMALVMAE